VAIDSDTGQIEFIRNVPAVVSQIYTVGSILKPAVAALALAQPWGDPQLTVLCHGYTIAPEERLSCWLKNGHGRLNLYKGLALSCNCYFYEIGRRLTGEELLSFLEELGLGRKTGIDLPSEEPGLVPASVTETERMKLAVGMTPRLQITVIQAAVMFTALVNGGRVLVPHVTSGPPEIRRTISTLAAGQSRLWRALQEATRYGTTAAYGREIPGGVAKTGTAPWVEGYHTHGWFLGTVPLTGRTLVLAVFVLRGSGSADAVPLAIDIAKNLRKSIR
jgi:cell division protein FtsI/penicillin-binding protein 2